MNIAQMPGLTDKLKHIGHRSLPAFVFSVGHAECLYDRLHLWIAEPSD
jgi:hypothetical protein